MLPVKLITFQRTQTSHHPLHPDLKLCPILTTLPPPILHPHPGQHKPAGGEITVPVGNSHLGTKHRTT